MLDSEIKQIREKMLTRADLQDESSPRITTLSFFWGGVRELEDLTIVCYCGLVRVACFWSGEGEGEGWI